jgi:erythronate-4-phosphate dehydrogenase
MKIFVDENIPMGREAFQDHGEVATFAGRSLSRADLADASADALIVRSITKVNADLLSGTPIRFVGTATIGTDHVDQAYLRKQGIGFSSAPGCNANSVGEYVSAALTRLEVEKGFALEGRVLGIIGYGHVGKNLARKAAALGLRVLKCDPPLKDLAKQSGGNPEEFAGLDDLLAESDIISLHVPLVKSGPHPTLGMVDAGFFARLKRPIVLLNTCRGEVIVERDLLAAQKAGSIRHLILDVFAGEPRIDASLCSLADIVTPHIAGYSLLGKLNGTSQIAEAFRKHFGFTSVWKPAYPGPAHPEIRYPASDALDERQVSDAAFRHGCIAAAYDILADDRRLRESLSEEDPGKAFDRLRRDYPIRHEFAGFRILGVPEEKRELRSRLGALGFRVG